MAREEVRSKKPAIDHLAKAEWMIKNNRPLSWVMTANLGHVFDCNGNYITTKLVIHDRPPGWNEKA